MLCSSGTCHWLEHGHPPFFLILAIHPAGSHSCILALALTILCLPQQNVETAVKAITLGFPWVIELQHQVIQHPLLVSADTLHMCIHYPRQIKK